MAVTMKKAEALRCEWDLAFLERTVRSQIVLLAALMSLTPSLRAQSAIPAGTILPLQLNTSLNTKKIKAGQIVSARLMQEVPLPSGAKIRAGAKATGRILDVVSARDGSGARISFQFDSLQVAKRAVPITTNLRALASMREVEDAQIPQAGPDRGTSRYWWTTVQIGGDVVYGEGGQVARGLDIVGTATADGTLGRPAPNPGMHCRGTISGNDHPQALWLFSANACGIYGFSDLAIVHAGRSSPVGQIALASAKGNISVHSGSGLLLRVQ